MGEYLIGIVFICAAISFISTFFDMQKNNGIFRFAVSVLLIYTIVTPFFKLGSDAFSSIEDILGDFDGSQPPPSDTGYIEYTEDALKDGILNSVSDRFGISKENISVLTFGFDFQSMTFERIHIILKNSAVTADSYAIENYVNGFEIGKCEVYIEVEK